MHDQQDMPQESGDCKGDHTPFMQFYTSDWTAGTIGFTFEQRGFYLEALKMMWELKGGLPDDITWLRFALRGDPRTVRKLRSFLLNKGKLHVKNGLLINPRMMREIAKWQRRQLAKVSGTSSKDQQTFDLIVPEKPTNSKGTPKVALQSDQSYPERQDRSFEPRVIDGGKSRPAQTPRFVSEAALDRVRGIPTAHGWDRQALLAKFLKWPKSKNAVDMDEAFLGWVESFTKKARA